MTRHLIVMLKEPRAGRVKTRLGQGIGMVPSAWWFRHQVRRLIRSLDDPRWSLSLAVSPDREGLNSRVWPAHLPRIPQGQGDPGYRMARLLRMPPPGPVVIVGGDIPGVSPALIEKAFRALGSRNAVFGPATDGGYWLVGLNRTRRPPPGLFHNVRWSSATALADTLATLPDHRIALIDTLQDIDTFDDLRTTLSE